MRGDYSKRRFQQLREENKASEKNVLWSQKSTLKIFNVLPLLKHTHAYHSRFVVGGTYLQHEISQLF